MHEAFGFGVSSIGEGGWKAMRLGMEDITPYPDSIHTNTEYSIYLDRYRSQCAHISC
jgi:hypothetical protein